MSLYLVHFFWFLRLISYTRSRHSNSVDAGSMWIGFQANHKTYFAWSVFACTATSNEGIINRSTQECSSGVMSVSWDAVYWMASYTVHRWIPLLPMEEWRPSTGMAAFRSTLICTSLFPRASHRLNVRYNVLGRCYIWSISERRNHTGISVN